MQELRQGLASDGSVYFALEQTEGKGQREKRWFSSPGENLIMSMVVDCSGFEMDQQFLFSAAVALACQGIFAAHAGEETCIKWPNDLLWRDRKAGGVLIENSIRGSLWEHAIVGMGININQTAFPEMDRKPVSLKQVTGKAMDPLELAQSLAVVVRKRLELLQINEGNQLLQEYNAHLYLKGQRGQFFKEGLTFEAVIQEVDAGGRLLLIDNHDQVQSFGPGELQWIS